MSNKWIARLLLSCLQSDRCFVSLSLISEIFRELNSSIVFGMNCFGISSDLPSAGITAPKNRNGIRNRLIHCSLRRRKCWRMNWSSLGCTREYSVMKMMSISKLFNWSLISHFDTIRVRFMLNIYILCIITDTNVLILLLFSIENLRRAPFLLHEHPGWWGQSDDDHSIFPRSTRSRCEFFHLQTNSSSKFDIILW